MKTFEQELMKLINQYAEENISDTPDFILAHYLASCLDIFNFAVIHRTRWYVSPKTESKQMSFPF